MSDWTPCAQFAKGWQDATVPDDECARFFKSIGITLTPKQYDFITCPADDVGMGGARGGAKSYGVVYDWLWHDHQHGENANGMVFRRERTQLVEFIAEATKIFNRVNTIIAPEPKSPKWQWHARDSFFESPNGSRLRFVYLDKDADADKYQSGNMTRLYIEERGTFPREKPLNMIMGILRSGVGVPAQMKSTFNPGGVGHQHCKERYRLHDKIPKGYVIFTTEEGGSRCFIPSKLRDNPHLGEPYIRMLRAACAGNEALLNAWLDGDWDVIEGAFFNAWSGQHVIPEFDIPSDWLRFRSIRWGSARPLSVGWWAVVGDGWPIRGGDFRDDESAHAKTRGERDDEQRVASPPRGSLIRYREWYAQKSPGSNEGLKLTAEQIAEGIRERTPQGERIFYTVANPQIWDTDGGPSLAERFARAGLPCIPGDDKTSKELGHAGGWDELRARLVGREGTPAIFCFTNCPDSVRTIPALQHDRDHPEEIDGESEANPAHDWRYAVNSRPWVFAPPKPKIPDGVGFYADENGVTKSTLTVRQIIDRMQKKRLAEEMD